VRCFEFGDTRDEVGDRSEFFKVVFEPHQVGLETGEVGFALAGAPAVETLHLDE